MIDTFKVIYRNPGHWDIWNDKRRIMRLRGGPSSYVVIDDINVLITNKHFKTVSTAMSYICDMFMYELIIVEGQEPTTIESWNIE